MSFLADTLANLSVFCHPKIMVAALLSEYHFKKHVSYLLPTVSLKYRALA
jgi:hypothetical protein